MNQMKKGRSRRSLALLGTTLGLLIAAPAMHAQPSNTNHGSATGISNANENGRNNSNVNGIGTGTAPVPEASTWAAMGAAVVAAGILARRRMRTAR